MIKKENLFKIVADFPQIAQISAILQIGMNCDNFDNRFLFLLKPITKWITVLKSTHWDVIIS